MFRVKAKSKSKFITQYSDEVSVSSKLPIVCSLVLLSSCAVFDPEDRVGLEQDVPAEYFAAQNSGQAKGLATSNEQSISGGRSLIHKS
ncbi:MAG: hypothetical protein GY804_13695 [Alphaproteobacteria bacterium]|nr:hypothetical protein [Alphaproteobacteria bacterium]